MWNFYTNLVCSTVIVFGILASASSSSQEVVSSNDTVDVEPSVEPTPPMKLLPPLLLTAKYTELHSVKAEWMLNQTMSSLQLRVTLALAHDSQCKDTVIQHTFPGSNSPVQSHTFRKLSQENSWTICLRVSSENRSSEWTIKTIELDYKRPPRITRGAEHMRILDVEDADPFAPFVEGDNFALPCETDGVPIPTVTWYFQNKPLDLNGTQGYSISDGKLLISHASDKHEGDYYCEAKSTAGLARSVTVTLHRAVLGDFSQEARPKVFKVNAGSNQALECTAPQSVPKAHITWHRPRRQYDPDPPAVVIDYYHVTQTLEGTLIFIYTTIEDESKYQCKATNDILGHTHTSSLYYDLQVEGHGYTHPPLLTYHSSRQVALVGEEFLLQCIYVGHPTPTVHWRKDGKLITGNDRYVIEHANQTLRIKSVRLEDAGTFTCQGENGKKTSIEKTLYIYVYERPSWKEKPQSQNVTVGEKAEFRCLSQGSPPPRTTFYKDGRRIQRSSRYIVSADGSTLTVLKARKEDIGNFQCRVANTEGSLFTDFYINVFLRTRITRPPKSVNLIPNDVMIFYCDAETDPSTTLTTTWLRANRRIHDEGRRIYFDTDSSLVINITKEQDGGDSFVTEYSCLVSNGLTNATASAKLLPRTIEGRSSSTRSKVIEGKDRRHGKKSGVGDLPVNSTVQSLPAQNFMEQKVFGVPVLWITVIGGSVCLAILVGSGFCIVRRKQAGDRTPPRQDPVVMTQLLENGDAVQRDGEITTDGFPTGIHPDNSMKDVLRDLFLPRDRLILFTLIGRGQFGRVYSGNMKDTTGKITEKVAIKTLRYKPEETEMVELFLREAVLMRDFQHENVLSLIGISFDTDGSPMVVLPYMANGDLRSYIQSPELDITVLELLKVGLQIARGMVYLSSKRFVHRDLAARNCMVDEFQNVKVADFGLSRDLYSRDYYRVDDYKKPLPVRWMAPECLSQGMFTTASDAWSFGIVLWELMTRGATPYDEVPNPDIPAYIERGERLTIPPYCPEAVYRIMQKCWNEVPQKRPSFEMLVLEAEAVICRAKTGSFSTQRTLYVNVDTIRLRGMSFSAESPTDYRAKESLV